MLFHKEKRDEDLDGEAFDQVQGKALEIVHFYEFVHVNAQQLEGQAQVVAEHELRYLAHNVFLVVLVVSVKDVDQLCLDKALLVKSLFVPQDLHCYKLFGLVVKTSEHNAERTFS